jgi:hypothetical protein
MTKHRSASKRSDRAEKAALSRHVGFGEQQSVAGTAPDAPDVAAENPKTGEVAFVGRPILGEYRSVPHGW